MGVVNECKQATLFFSVSLVYNMTLEHQFYAQMLLFLFQRFYAN